MSVEKHNYLVSPNMFMVAAITMAHPITIVAVVKGALLSHE
jgi:hypothetical protein